VRTSILTACLFCGIASLIGAPGYANEISSSWSQSRPNKLNPVTLLREAIAALMPAVGQDEALGGYADVREDLAIDFASDNEYDRVSVSLADSQVRVRLGDELRLHCEVSSRDELDTDPELGIDLGLRFRFK
jgi:hypothetical protein